MSDYQHIPGGIRSFLATKAQTWSEHSINLATQYAILCDQTNQRLRRCAEYLRLGMLSAAVHLADCQPNLCQSVTHLQFAERGAWADLCVTNGMPAPAVLEIDCLDQLKEAYEREKKLEPLLSRQRILAIAKAPAGQRLEVARILATEDPENSCWIEEILILESARFYEIGNEAKGAIRDQNDQVLQSLLTELSTNPWRLDVPEDVTQLVQNAIAATEVRRGLKELPSLAAELSSKFEPESATAEVIEHINCWKVLTAIPGLEVPPDLQALVQPALDWQNGQRQRQDAIAEAKPLAHLFEPEQAPLRRKRRTSLLLSILAIIVVAAWRSYSFAFIICDVSSAIPAK